MDMIQSILKVGPTVQKKVIKLTKVALMIISQVIVTTSIKSRYIFSVCQNNLVINFSIIPQNIFTVSKQSIVQTGLNWTPTLKVNFSQFLRDTFSHEFLSRARKQSVRPANVHQKNTAMSSITTWKNVYKAMPIKKCLVSKITQVRVKVIHGVVYLVEQLQSSCIYNS